MINTSGWLRAKERAESVQYGTRERVQAAIESAVDEALERAAKVADAHVDHGEFTHGSRHECEEAIASEIRQLKSQPQPLPPTVKHNRDLPPDRCGGDGTYPYVQVKHGVDCPKVEHIPWREGYLHGSYEDLPYDVDGVKYCGRCHQAL